MTLVKYKSRLIQKWWLRWIRSYNWFSFRYWWLNYLLWTVLISLLIWLFSFLIIDNYDCAENKEINRLLRRIDMELENCCNCNIEVPTIDTIASIDDLDRLRDSLGGHVGEITITLIWKTKDDLDLILVEPDGTKINFSHKRSHNGGILDVDKNVANLIINPIENIYYSGPPPQGKYRIEVKFYQRNSRNTEIPYTVYVKYGKEIKNFNAVHSTVSDIHFINEFYYPSL